jgi:spermidine synthase
MPPVVIIALVVVAVCALVLALLVVLRRKLAEAGVYVVPRTLAGPALVMTVEDDAGDAVRVLNVGGMYQSATYLDDDRVYEPVFTYYKLFDRMFDAERSGAFRVRRVLMVGGGGYAYPKHLVSAHEQVSVDVVEIDPAITAIAQRYFFLDRLVEEFETEQTGRLNLVCDDGRAVLDRTAAAGARPYDAVVNDSFSGKEPAACMTTVEAARAIKGSLVEGGVYLTNVVSALEGDGSRFVRSVVATLEEVFAHVYVIPAGTDELAERDNNVVVATDGPYVFEGVCALGPGPEGTVMTDAHNPVRELTR